MGPPDDVVVSAGLGCLIACLGVNIVADFQAGSPVALGLDPRVSASLGFEVEHTAQVLPLLVVLLLLESPGDGGAPGTLLDLREDGLVEAGAVLEQRLDQLAHLEAMHLVREVIHDQAVEVLEDGEQVLQENIKANSR